MTTKILPYPGHAMYLNEMFQSNEIKFAFVNPHECGFIQVHPYIKCREYFNEFLMTNSHNNFNFEVTYGFDYNKAAHPLQMDATRLALQFPNNDVKNIFIKNLPFIHAIEENNKIPLCSYIDIDITHLVIIADNFYLKQCLLLNLFSMLLKLAALDPISHTWESFMQVKARSETPTEISYIYTLGKATFNKLFSNLQDIYNCPSKYVDGFNELRSDGSIHASSGICTMQYYAESTDHIFPIVNTVRQIFKKDATTTFFKEE